MVRVKTSRPGQRRHKMTDLDRQSDWTQHLNRNKSIRLRNAARRFEPLANLHESLSINHNHHRQTRQTVRHHRQSQHQQVSASSGCNVSNNPMMPTSSGNQLTISAQVGRNKPKSTSARIMKPYLKFCAPQAAMSVTFVGIMLMVSAKEMLWCNCDTSQMPGGGGGHHERAMSPADFQPKVPDSVKNYQLRRLDGGAPSSAGALPMSHKERFLMSLTDNIERQHMRLSPSIRSFALARPSKFDSGSESLQEEPGTLGAGRIHARSSSPNQAPPMQHVKTLDDIMSQHYQQGSRKSASFQSDRLLPVSGGSPAGNKADQELRQIMMLHEQAASTYAQSTAKPMDVRPSSGYLQRNRTLGNYLTRFKSAPGEFFDNRKSNFSSSTGESPLADGAKAAQALSNVIAYLNPLALANNSKRPQQNLTHPFTSRTSAKTFLVGPLLGLGQMFASPDGNQKVANKYSLPAGGHGAGGSAENQASYVLSNAINQPQGYSSNLKGPIRGKEQSGDHDLVAEATSSSSASSSWPSRPPASKSFGDSQRQQQQQQQQSGRFGGWIKNGANQLAQSYLQDSFRDLLTLTQLPILSGSPVSTAPSELEPGGKKYTANRISNQQVKGNRTHAVDELFRYAYILGNLGVRRKRDPLKVLGSSPASNSLLLANENPLFSLRGQLGLLGSGQNSPVRSPSLSALIANRKIKPRGVMWDMATDPSLAVTVFHLLERASVALPLGFLLMPFVHMIRNPLNGINLGRIIPARASHRSVDYEEIAKKIDMMDKILSRALRPTHRESGSLSFIKR